MIFVILLFVFYKVKNQNDDNDTPTNNRYDSRGFDHNKIHENGTKFDDYGYDYYGYDADGFNCNGYNRVGRNRNNQYNRLFDVTSCKEEGFSNPRIYHIAISDHARERFCERLSIFDEQKMYNQACVAYKFGKSKRQIKKSSQYFVEKIENRYEDGIVLIYKGFIYVYSSDNVLITVYKNERIPL